MPDNPIKNPNGGSVAPARQATAAGTQPAGSPSPDKKTASKKTVKIAAIAAAAVLGIGALVGGGVAYASYQENLHNIEFYQEHFYEHTSVGGVDISRLTVDEAASAVNGELSKIGVVVKDGDNETSFKVADAGVEEVDDAFFDELLEKQDPENWKEEQKADHAADMPELVYDKGKIDDKVAEMDCVSGKDRTDAVDAVLTMKDGEFSVTPGKDGNKVDGDTISALVFEKLTGGNWSADGKQEAGKDESDKDKDSKNENTESKASDNKSDDKAENANDESSDSSDASEDKSEKKKSYDIDEDGIPDDEDDLVDADHDGYYDEAADIEAARKAIDEKEEKAAKEKAKKEKEAKKKADSAVKVDAMALSEVVAANAADNVIDASEYFAHPKWTGTEPEFTSAEETAKKWLGAKIDYTIDMVPHAAVVDNKVIEDFIVIDQDKIQVELDEDAVKKWLHEACAPYDTVGTTRTYTTPAGNEIKVSGGHYGWMTDEATELPLLIERIKNGESGTFDMSYEQEAVGPKGGAEWGDTYVDIDISAQTVSYIRSGKVVFTADTVTGNEDASHETQRGFYSILMKKSPHVMVGDIDPKTGKPEYETPCQYFMLFNYNGSAMHDATFRYNWSKDAHFYDGSHGCANMQYADAETMWGLCENGDPVIVHD